MIFELILKKDGKTILQASFSGWLSKSTLRYDGDLTFESEDIDDALFLLRNFLELIEEEVYV